MNSHAAHYKNICDKLGSNKANEVFWGYLSDNSPSDFILGPLNVFVRSLFENKFMRKMVDKVIPPVNGLYARHNLTEYMAEKNARLIAEDLGDNLSLKYNCDLPLDESSDWSLVEEFTNNPLLILNPGACIDIIKRTIKYFDQDIWNGDVQNLKKAHNMFYRYKKTNY